MLPSIMRPTSSIARRLLVADSTPSQCRGQPKPLCYNPAGQRNPRRAHYNFRLHLRTGAPQRSFKMAWLGDRPWTPDAAIPVSDEDEEKEKEKLDEDEDDDDLDEDDDDFEDDDDAVADDEDDDEDDEEEEEVADDKE